MAMQTVTVTINGVERSAEVEPRTLLVHYIRDHLRQTGTHIGCDTTSCGACTVMLDGTTVKSCTLFAVQAHGKSIGTVEGLAEGGKLHPIQEGFKETHGLQCGFCAGKAPNSESIGEAARLAAESAEPVSDNRAPADYKRAMVKELTRRALDRAVDRAKGGK